MPICQDTGMAVFHRKRPGCPFYGGGEGGCHNEGVRQGYTDGYLRKSVVKDPLIRKNTATTHLQSSITQ